MHVEGYRILRRQEGAMSMDQPDALSMLIRHEGIIGELYQTFASIFSDRADFWQSLAEDEQRHAEQLDELRSNPITSTWLLYSSPFKIQAIHTAISYIENQIERAKDGNLSDVQALSIAKDLENSLLERQFSSLINTAPIEIKPTIVSLANETERHLKQVVEAISSLAKSQGR